MTIDPSSGDVVLFELRVGPSLTQRAFLESSASSRFVPNDMGTGFVH